MCCAFFCQSIIKSNACEIRMLGHKFINRLTSDLHKNVLIHLWPDFWVLQILQANRIILRIINVFVFHMQIRLVLSSLRLILEDRPSDVRPNKVKLFGNGFVCVCVCVCVTDRSISEVH